MDILSCSQIGCMTFSILVKQSLQFCGGAASIVVKKTVIVSYDMSVVYDQNLYFPSFYDSPMTTFHLCINLWL